MKKKGQRKRRLKLKTKVFLKLLLIILVFLAIFFFIFNLNTKNIVIKGNTEVKDVDIIRTAGLENYPKIFRLNTKKIKNNLKQLPLIDDVKIKRNIFGKITITVTESKILFYYKYDNKYVTTSNRRIDVDTSYYGYPTIINFTPDTVLDNLVTGLNKVDYNIIKMINEIEYSPYKSSTGETIEDNRFILKMNDGNTVYVDTPNIRNLDKYTTIIATPDMASTKGIVYLDTINEQIVFRSYDAVNKEAEEQAAKENSEEEQKEETEN